MINLERELQDNNRYLDEAKRSADGAATSIDGFGREVKDTAPDLDSLGGGLGNFVGQLGNLKNVIAGGVVVGGIKALGDAIFGVVESTEEYRSIVGTLEVSSQAAGYSAEQTAEAYERLYGVLGDTQTAATTVANLQAIGLSQQDLMTLVDAATGAWATYGDSIPIDGLSEAINETIQAGTVTGVFADVLNWAGTSEDAFNEKLAAANSSTERANLVLKELAEQGLAETGQAWRENNADIVEMNESQAELEAAMGRMGELLSPLAAKLVSFGADALEFVIEKVQSAVEWFTKLNEKMNTQSQSRMESYGYEAYYNEEGLLRYRQTSVTNDLAAANVSEQPAATARDVYNAAAASANAAISASGTGRKEYVGTTVITIDGREVARATQPYLRDEDKSNPEVVSDQL